MRHFNKLKQYSLWIVLSFFYASFASSAILIQVDDEPSEGFNDPEFGAARLAVFEQAATILSSQLLSEIDIVVLARFDELTCTPTSATLGSASPNSTAYNFNNTPKLESLYPIALANAIAKEDLEPDEADVIAVFNSALDSGLCLGGSTWYYEFDTAPNNKVSLLEVVLHELIHGLGFISTVAQDGSRLYYQWVNGEGVVLETVYLDDPFMSQLVNGNGENWGDLDGSENEDGNATRELDSVSELYFSGPNTNFKAKNKVNGVNNGLIKMYTPSQYNSASNVSHFDTEVSPDEVMEPFNTGNSTGIGLALDVLKDIGWPATNTPSVLIGQQPLSTDEDTAISINLSDLIYEDPDSNASDLTIELLTGENYNVSDNLITPSSNFNGEIFVDALIVDGNDNSNSITLTITVNPVNDAPEILSQNGISTLEDSPVTISIDDFNIIDPEGDPITLTLLEGENYQIIDNQLIPNSNFFGDLRVNVQVNDQSDFSEVFVASVAITAQNDTPFFIMEEEYLASINNSFSLTILVEDADNDRIQYSVNSRPNWLTLNDNTLNGTPSLSNLGTHAITLNAYDGTMLVSHEIEITVLENHQVDFSIQETDQNLLIQTEESILLNFAVSGSGQLQREEIEIEFTSNIELINDLCSPITNGLSCPYTLMNTTDIFSITTQSDIAGSYKINAKIANIPSSVEDTNLNNQEASIWLTVVEQGSLIIDSIADINFENEIKNISTDKDNNFVAVNLQDAQNQLITIDSKGQYALISKFAEDYDTSQILLMDINKDSHTDALLLSDTQNAQVYINESNALILNEDFSMLPGANIDIAIEIKPGVLAISNQQSIYVIEANSNNSFDTLLQIDIEKIQSLQIIDINQDNIEDLIVFTGENEYKIFNGINDTQLFDGSSIGFTTPSSDSVFSANFADDQVILAGDENGFSLLKFDDSELITAQELNTGQTKQLHAIEDKSVFYTLNESGTIFVYHYTQEGTELISTMHASFSNETIVAESEENELALWASQDNKMVLFNVELNHLNSEITLTDTSVETQTDTQSETMTDTQTDTLTDTQTQTSTDTNEDLSTPISNSADSEPTTVKIGQFNLIWLAMISLFGFISIRSNRKQSK